MPFNIIDSFYGETTGDHGNPHVLGSLNYGASTSQSSSGFYGGSADKNTNTSSGSTAFTDTWDRSKGLLDTGNAITEGVNVDIFRFYTGSGIPPGKGAIFTRKMTIDSKGEVVAISSETLLKSGDAVISGRYDNPYIMGSTNYGSSTSGPGGTAGPWGGSSDARSVFSNTPLEDTWHRDRPPRDTGNNATYGVKMDLERIYIVSGGGYYSNIQRYVFTRKATFDSLGSLVYIDKEVLEETGTISGSGSAAGGI